MKIKIIKSGIIIISYVFLLSCNGSKHDTQSAPTDQTFENEILNWFNNNKEGFTDNQAVKKHYVNFNLPLVISGYNLSIDPVLYPTDLDKQAYVYLNREGFNSSYPEDVTLIGMMIAKTFKHTESNNFYEFYGRVIQSTSDFNNLLSDLDIKDNEFHEALNEFKKEMIFDGSHVYLISGNEYRNYESAVETFTEDENMKQLFVSDRAKFKSLYGDGWKNSCTTGFYTYSLKDYVIGSFGNHSKEEVLYALQLLDNIGRKRSSTEEFWVDWVLGYYDNQFSSKYPSLAKVLPAIYDSPTTHWSSRGILLLNNMGKINEYYNNNAIKDIASISRIKYTYKYYE